MFLMNKAFATAFTSAIVNIVLKKLSNKKIHFSVVAIYASYFGLPLSATISFILVLTGVEVRNATVINNKTSLCFQIFYSLTSAICGVLSQIFFNISMKHEDASKIAIYRSTDFFFTYMFQYLWLDILANYLSVIGALLILAGTLLIIFFKIVDKNFNQIDDRFFVFKRIMLFKF